MINRSNRFNRRHIVLGLTFVGLLAACEDDKKKALLEKTAPSATVAPVASPAAAGSAASAAPAASVAETKSKPVLCPDGPGLTLTDPELEAELRLKLSKPKDPLKMADLGAVRSLNLTKKAALDELDPCIFTKLTGLKHLYLPPGKLRDLTPIANLTSLESLRASINEVEDLTPLTKLVLLDRVDLGRTHVRDLAPLANLTNLTELQLDDTQISDLAPLAKCKKLEKLSIKHTTVADVSPLKGLEKLKFLYVEGCAINNLDILGPRVSRGLKVVTK